MTPTKEYEESLKQLQMAFHKKHGGAATADAIGSGAIDSLARMGMILSGLGVTPSDIDDHLEAIVKDVRLNWRGHIVGYGG